MIWTCDTEFMDLRYAYREPIVGCAYNGYARLTFTTSEQMAQWMRSLSEETILAGHNIKEEFKTCRISTDGVKAKLFDTLIASWLLNENIDHSLEAESLRLLRRSIDKPIKRRDNQLFWKNYQTPFSEAPIEEVTEYCHSDCVATWQLVPLYMAGLKAEGLENHYWTIEEPFLRCLIEMEQRPLTINEGARSELSSILANAIDLTCHHIFGNVGYVFNLNSPPQLRSVLYTKEWETSERGLVGYYKSCVHKPDATKCKVDNCDGPKPRFGRIAVPRRGCGLKPVLWTDNDDNPQPSTKGDALRILEERGEGGDLIPALLEYRQLSKLQSTYIEAFPRYMKDGKTYASFNRTGTVTGRLSSGGEGSFNLQNIPIRTDAGKQVRNLFIPKEGHSLVVADHSQIEYRILAHATQEPVLLQAFKDGKDVHEATASLFVGEDKAKAYRFVGKTLNYAAVYGAGPGKIATILRGEGLHWSAAECGQALKKYYSELPNVGAWKQRTIGRAKRLGYITCLSGRRRRVPDLQSHNYGVRTAAERQVVNSYFQGSAMDILQVAMVTMWYEDIPMILTVHDEVVAEVPDSEAAWYEEVMKDIMEAEVFGMTVPVECSTAIVKQWGAAK